MKSLREVLAKFPTFRGQDYLLRSLDNRLGPVVVEVRDGLKLPLLLSSTQDKAFCKWRKDTNPVLTEAIRMLDSKATFFDVGANVGFYSAMVASHLNHEGIVVSVEPSEREFARLVRTRELNNFECRWHLVNEIAGPLDGETAFLDCGRGHTGMNAVVEADGARNREGTRKACTVTVDTLVQVFGLERIDLMKVDVEGFEMNVLKGAKRSLERGIIGAIAIEVTDEFLRERGCSRDALYDFLKSFAYNSTCRQDSWQFDDLFVRVH